MKLGIRDIAEMFKSRNREIAVPSKNQKSFSDEARIHPY